MNMVYPEHHQASWSNTCRDSTVYQVVWMRTKRYHKTVCFSRQHTVNAKLSDQQNSDLQLDLSEREIETAISQMAKGKAPGPNGLSIEFYTHCWPIVKDEVVSLLREMFSTQTIHPQIKTGYLTLIHKKRQKNEISNYRPISLLNYDLKILTKCLTNRIKTIISDLTHEH